MPATDDESDSGSHTLRRPEKWGEEMTFEMIDRQERLAGNDGETLCSRCSDHQRGRQTRTARGGKCIDRLDGQVRTFERMLQHRLEHAQMISRSDLGYHATVRRVQRDLRSHFACEEHRSLNDRDCRLVTGAVSYTHLTLPTSD